MDSKAWRKSSYSGTNGDCVEVGSDGAILVRDTEAWRKSTHSGTNGDCIETATGQGVILVRDTKNRDGGALAFGADAWASFVTSLQAGFAS
jgi:Domain of unknown function (DUF397)